MDTIDLTKLVQTLRAVPEEKPDVTSDLDVNEYLKTHLLPIFYSGRFPRLSDIDFDQFDAEDLRMLSYFVRQFGCVELGLSEINRVFCLARPSTTKCRTFL